MTIEVGELRTEVGASAGDDSRLTRCLTTGTALLDTYLTDNEIDPGADLPEAIYDQALLTVAVDLWNQSQAPNGIVNQQYDAGAGEVGTTAIRISRDPLRGVYSLLQTWVIPSIGAAGSSTT